MTSRVVGLLAVVGVLLAACDALDLDYLGQPPPPPLPGERIAILQLEQDLAADPGIAETPIVLPPPIPTPNWPQNGGLVDKAMLHVAAPGDLTEAWSAGIGEGEGRFRRLIASPVSALGVVYTMDADAEVRAFDINTGDELWDVDLTPEIEDDGGWGGGLAFYRGRIYATTGFGEVVLLDAQTGEEYWRRTLGPPLRAAPTVSQGRLYVLTSDNELVVMDADTGETLWTHRGIEETAGLLGGASPAISGSAVVVAYSSGEIYALQAENGRVIWSDILSYGSRIGSLAALNDINASTVIDSGQVFAVSHGGRLVAIDLAAGARLWERQLSGVQMPWVAGDYIYIVTTDGNVVCLVRADGRVRWVTPLPQYEDVDERDDPIMWNGPLLVSDRLLVTSTSGQVVSISPYTGEILGALEPGDGFPLAPIAAQETVFLIEDSGSIIALR
ncbi:MAG: PQQ-binding-like beta-propeller repeat protein [Pseudomonadota bacterium]